MTTINASSFTTTATGEVGLWTADVEVRRKKPAPWNDAGSIQQAEATIRAGTEALRYIALHCGHFPGLEPGHIQEPSTGGMRYCGPCHAWRVLNGSPYATDRGYDNDSDQKQQPAK